MQHRSLLWHRRNWCARVLGLSAGLASATLAGCATATRTGSGEFTTGPHPNDTDQARMAAADFILLGEQHDAKDHHALEAQCTAWLVEQGRLGALVLEMAYAGDHTAALDTNATSAQVQSALAWRDDAWPWADYGGAIMTAVRAGVPVYGGNLPPSAMPTAMRNSGLSAQVTRSAWQALLAAVSDGHCGLLPSGQVAPMARIQIAKDQSLAHTLSHTHVPQRTSLLLCGNAHANRLQGIPLHMASAQGLLAVHLRATNSPAAAAGAFDLEWLTAATPPRDYCGELKAQWAHRKSAL
jgi:uncharacterized iron-regulated protein